MLRLQPPDGSTLLFVSHSAGMITEFCDRALWLDHGELVMQGTAEEVLLAYEGRVAISQSV